MKKLALAVIIGSLLTACGGGGGTTTPPTPQPETIRTYAVTDSTLYNIVLFGNETDEKVMDLSYSGSITDVAKSGNYLYASTFSTLMRIDPQTKSITEVGRYGVSDINALTVDSNGQMLAASLSGKLYKINTQTGLATEIANVGYRSSGDLVSLNDGTIYLTVKNGGSSDSLAKMRLGDAKAIIVGNIGYNDVFGLDYGNGVLYGRTAAGEIIQINPVTLETKVLRKTGLHFTSL